MDINDKIRATKTLINSQIAIGVPASIAVKEWGNLILETHRNSIKRGEELLKSISPKSI